MHNFHTTIGVFIAILLAYLVICLALGAKNLYFGPFVEKPDSKSDESEKSHATEK